MVYIEDDMREQYSGIVSSCVKQFLQFDCTPEFIDNGIHKLVYKVRTPQEELIAVAAAYDESNLEKEFDKLDELHQSCPQLFPEAKSVFTQDDIDVILMEFLPHVRVDKFKAANPGRDREIARSIGYATGYVLKRTGQFTEEPHNGNILLGLDGNIVEARFVDADHFVGGMMFAAMDTYESELPNTDRPECREYWTDFVESVQIGVEDARAGRLPSFRKVSERLKRPTGA